MTSECSGCFGRVQWQSAVVECCGTSVSGASHYIECVTPIGIHRRPPAYTHTAKKISKPLAMLRNSQVASSCREIPEITVFIVLFLFCRLSLASLLSQWWWQSAVVECCGRVHWQCAVVECCGRVLWQSAVGECSGRVLWQSAVVECCGKVQWQSAVASVLVSSYVQENCEKVVFMITFHMNQVM